MTQGDDNSSLEDSAGQELLRQWAPARLGEFASSPPEDRLIWLRNAIAPRIADLLTNDYAKLLSVLYRLDVGEAKVKAAIKEADVFDVPFVIADLIIARELEKAKTRAKYPPPSKS